MKILSSILGRNTIVRDLIINTGCQTYGRAEAKSKTKTKKNVEAHCAQVREAHATVLLSCGRGSNTHSTE